MGRLLIQRGHTVAFAGDGLEFMAIIQGTAPPQGAAAAGSAAAGSAAGSAAGATGGAGGVGSGGGAGGVGATGNKVVPAAATVSASYDAILMDRHMPQLEGPDAAR